MPGTQCCARTGSRAYPSRLSRPAARSRDSSPALRPAPGGPRPAQAGPCPRHGAALTGTAAEPPPAPPGLRVPVGAGLATSPRAAPRLPRFRFPSRAGPGGRSRSEPALTHFQRGGPGSPHVWRPPLPSARAARRRHGPDAAVPALRTRRALRAGGQRQGRRGLRGAARRAGPLRGRAGLRARVRVGHKERREGGSRGAVPGQGWGAACGALRAAEAKLFMSVRGVWREAAPAQPLPLQGRVSTA